jgi:hypothetical protein
MRWTSTQRNATACASWTAPWSESQDAIDVTLLPTAGSLVVAKIVLIRFSPWLEELCTAPRKRRLVAVWQAPILRELPCQDLEIPWTQLVRGRARANAKGTCDMQQLAVVSALVDLLADPSVQSMPVRTPADIARVFQVAYQAKYDLAPQPGPAKLTSTRCATPLDHPQQEV